MMKTIGNVTCERVIHSDIQLGPLKSCLSFLGIDLTLPWLAGATGHAFTIVASEDICPSGPSCIWELNRDDLVQLAGNIGCVLKCVAGSGELPLRQEAWDMAREALDEGYPCYSGGGPTISGYDDVGYYVGDDAKGPVPWQEGPHGWTEMCAVRPGEPADDTTTVRDALDFAVRYSELTPDRGLAAYDNWTRAVTTGSVDTDAGGLCDAHTWLELRKLAVQFLDEANHRIGGDACALFDEAKSHYEAVCGRWAKVAHTFRFETISRHRAYLEDAAVREETIGHLEAAKAAETAAIEALGWIVTAVR